MPARGGGGPGAESSALMALYRDQTRIKAYVLNIYSSYKIFHTFKVFLGQKGCKIDLVHGTKAQLIFKCNSNKKCSLRHIKSY